MLVRYAAVLSIDPLDINSRHVRFALSSRCPFRRAGGSRRAGDEFGAAVHAEPFVDALGVVADGGERDAEVGGDLLVGEAVEQAPADFLVARGDRLTVRARRERALAVVREPRGPRDFGAVKQPAGDVPDHLVPPAGADAREALHVVTVVAGE